MGLIEAILLGFQSEKLEKPLVFFMMLIAFVVFLVLALVMLAIPIMDGIDSGSFHLGTLVAGVAISLFFAALAALSAYFVKKCFD